MSTGKYPHVINVLLVLTVVRVEVERGRVGYIASRVIRNDGDVVAYLVLVRIAFKRIKRSTDGDVGRPCYTAIRAVRVE